MFELVVSNAGAAHSLDMMMLYASVFWVLRQLLAYVVLPAVVPREAYADRKQDKRCVEMSMRWVCICWGAWV